MRQIRKFTGSRFSCSSSPTSMPSRARRTEACGSRRLSAAFLSSWFRPSRGARWTRTTWRWAAYMAHAWPLLVLSALSLAPYAQTCKNATVVQTKPVVHEQGDIRTSPVSIEWNGDTVASYSPLIDASVFGRWRPVTYPPDASILVLPGGVAALLNSTHLSIYNAGRSRRHFIPIYKHSIGHSTTLRGRRAITAETVACSISVYYTPRLAALFGSNYATENGIAQASAIAAAVYARDVGSLVPVISQIQVWSGGSAVQAGWAIETTLSAFASAVPNPMSRCATVLFDTASYGTTVGVATVDTTCSSTAHGVVTFSDLGTAAVVFAHEIGHILGAEHVPTPTVMHYDISVAGFTFAFSATSDAVIDSTAASAACLALYNNSDPYIPPSTPGDDALAVILITSFGSVAAVAAIILLIDQSFGSKKTTRSL